MTVQWRFPTYRPATAPRREGSEDFKTWPSNVGTTTVPYSPPVGVLAGSSARSAGIDWLERNRVEQRRKREALTP